MPANRIIPAACGRNHPLDAKNTYIDPTGKWHCKACISHNAFVRQERKVAEKLESLRIPFPGDELDLAYGAGMFEGEGTISINSSGKRHYTRGRVSLANTDPGVVLFYQERWGGAIREQQPGGNRGTGPNFAARKVLNWTADATAMYTFLHQIKPYLRRPLVINKATLAMTAYEARRQGSRDQAYQDLHDHYTLIMHTLNHRGTSPQGALRDALKERAAEEILTNTPRQWLP